MSYLLETHHPKSRADDDRAELERSIASTEWTNLIVLGTERGGQGDATGTVEFVAALRRKKLSILTNMPASEAIHVAQLHETSRFVREGGRWFYVDGDRLPDHQPKRNDPCWCGSGKKMKACHG